MWRATARSISPAGGLGNSHSQGCRRWFNAERDTVSYRFSNFYKPGEKLAAPAADTEAGGGVA